MSQLTDYAWAAGFIDGEGYITVTKKNPTYGVRRSGPNVGRPRKEGVTYTLSLMVVNNNPAPIQRLVDLFGGHSHYVERVGGKSNYYRWRASGKAALAVLELIVPFLVGKQQIATVGISFQHWYTDTQPDWGKNMAPARRETAEQFHQECRRLIRLYRQVSEGRKENSPALAEVLPIAVGSED